MKIFLLSLLVSALAALNGQELLGYSAAAQSDLGSLGINNALNMAEYNANHMAWASQAPQLIPLGGNALDELAFENNKLMHKDLALLLNTAKTSVQFPVHTRVQPIVQSIPHFAQPAALPILTANPRTELLTTVRNPLLMQAAITGTQPVLNSKSTLAQAVLQRGMASAQVGLDAPAKLSFADLADIMPIHHQAIEQQFVHPQLGNIGYVPQMQQQQVPMNYNRF